MHRIILLIVLAALSGSGFMACTGSSEPIIETGQSLPGQAHPEQWYSEAQFYRLDLSGLDESQRAAVMEETKRVAASAAAALMRPWP